MALRASSAPPRTVKTRSSPHLKGSSKCRDRIRGVQHANGREKADHGSRELVFSFVESLKACAQNKDLHQGRRLHADIRDRGLLDKRYIGSALVSMYAKCGALARAQHALEELPYRDVVSWSALITGYVQQGHGQEALDSFRQMCREGLSPDAITYVSVLKACGLTKDIDLAKKIHEVVANQGLLRKDVYVGNALIEMYVKCGAFQKAQKVLEKLSVRNVISWTILIAGHVQQGQPQEALDCFQTMQSEGLSPDAFTFACILKACGSIKDIKTGKGIHKEVVGRGLLKTNIVLGNALIDMYAKCGVFKKAQKVLNELPNRDVVSWNSLITGYVREGHGQEALVSFRRMRSEGHWPDIFTYACSLKACGITHDISMGKSVHDEIVSKGLLEKSIVVGNALIDMYVKCCALTKAQKVFDELPVRDVVSWNALIGGYANQGQTRKALSCFQLMRNDGISGDAVTYASILKACSLRQDIHMGKMTHDEILNQGLLQKNVMLGNALVDMYAKCGALGTAKQVFDELLVRNVVSWSALIAGYAQEGQAQEALGCFKQMQKEGFSPDIASWNALIGAFSQQGLAKEALDCFQWMQSEGMPPNAISFVNILNACNHSGLVDEGQMYFDSMREIYGIAPDNEHCTCMVELFGRARLFDKAMRVIDMIPSFDHPPVWSALLGACQKWGNVKLGRLAFEHAIQIDRYDAAAYVIMYNVYAAAGMQVEAQNIEFRRSSNAI